MRPPLRRLTPWQVALGLLASLSCCCACPVTTFLGHYPGSRIVALLFFKAGPTLLKKTGLALPPSAVVREFHYAEGLRGDGMTLTFECPKEDALGFVRQKPLGSAAWERQDDPQYNELKLPEMPRAPFRSTEVTLAEDEWLWVVVEERKQGPWTVRVNWGWG